MKITYTCQQCGAEVTKHRSPATIKTTPRFCSQKCNGDARRGTGSGPRPNTLVSCSWCGTDKMVYRSPGAAAPVYCGKECKDEAQSGTGNPSWSGGRHSASGGHILVHCPGHPDADVRGYIYEHRLVMERHVGRRLSPVEVVHHINLDKTDNRVENLMLLPNQSEHMKIHAALKVAEQ